ncbi:MULTISPECIES: hypothetical protein [Aequorivita]|uniref:Uncharacterized protein n=1 Tax=Aequorivita iocasae TaxID=2803865 RepID=A0ABX7DWV7_9FLAO|nr:MULTISPECIES: hypothetical protein [Aequorivita]QQX78265.1 hypothetical protein JK629_01920 [Aequorivita iocasae]UCA56537.1 hypothetical protein LDL78_01935 [Aequorivita sp. F7]
MKNVILIAASLIVLTKPLWPVVEYVVNYDYIVNVLCENKDKPEMKCNGKCHLSKELAKEAGAENDNPFNSKTSKTEIPQFIISENIDEYAFAWADEIIIVESIDYRPHLNSSLFTSKIFHPPQLG